MARDFSERIQITNPPAYHLGRYIMVVGVIALLVGLVTFYTDELLMSPQAWCALAVPGVGIGGILIWVSLTKI